MIGLPFDHHEISGIMPFIRYIDRWMASLELRHFPCFGIRDQ
jgi:hypothetical protein